MTDAPGPELRGPKAKSLTLRVPAETAYLAAVRELVAAAAREHGFAPCETAKAVMAVDEACVNVIEHAYRPEDPSALRLLEVHVQVDEERLHVTIADRAGSAFSPLEHPADLESYWAAERRKGLGVLILRTFMDDVSHLYRPGQGNELRLVKYASRPPAPVPV